MNAATIREPQTTVSIVGDADLYEVIDGQRVALPPMGILAVWVASQIHLFLGSYGLTKKAGRALCEALFHLPLVRPRDRRPDVAFVTYQRWPKNRPIPPTDNAWDVVPDLAVEVVSPTDTAEELRAKIGEYFQAGVRLVWVVFPLGPEIHVYESPTQILILTTADTLDGGAVLPGFQLILAELFAETGDNGTTTLTPPSTPP